LVKGADPEITDPAGDTAIIRAAKAGQSEMVQLLKKAGAQYVPNLYTATGLGDAAAVQDLISKGADANARDQSGETALSCSDPYPEIRKLLTKAGAKEG